MVLCTDCEDLGDICMRFLVSTLQLEIADTWRLKRHLKGFFSLFFLISTLTLFGILQAFNLKNQPTLDVWFLILLSKTWYFICYCFGDFDSLLRESLTGSAARTEWIPGNFSWQGEAERCSVCSCAILRGGHTLQSLDKEIIIFLVHCESWSCYFWIGTGKGHLTRCLRFNLRCSARTLASILILFAEEVLEIW